MDPGHRQIPGPFQILQAREHRPQGIDNRIAGRARPVGRHGGQQVGYPGQGKLRLQVCLDSAGLARGALFLAAASAGFDGLSRGGRADPRRRRGCGCGAQARSAGSRGACPVITRG